MKLYEYPEKLDNLVRLATEEGGLSDSHCKKVILDQVHLHTDHLVVDIALQPIPLVLE